jgi:hypothetical protein
MVIWQILIAENDLGVFRQSGHARNKDAWSTALEPSCRTSFSHLHEWTDVDVCAHNTVEVNFDGVWQEISEHRQIISSAIMTGYLSVADCRDCI